MTPYRGDVVSSNPDLPVSVAPATNLVFNFVGAPSIEEGTVVGNMKISKNGEDSILDIVVDMNGSSLNLQDENGEYQIIVSKDSIGGGIFQGTFDYIGEPQQLITIKEIEVNWPS